MIELRGKYNTAKVFTDNIEQAAIDQLTELMNYPFVEGSQIRIMPDVHSGKGCVIGTTMTLKDKVCPNLVGCDIGCGMLAVKLKDCSIDYAKIDDVIRKYVPSGMNVNEFEKKDMTSLRVEDLRCFKEAQIRSDLVYKSVGTLGGGNHFIEIDKDENDDFWLVIHTGSRHLGIEVCDYYQKAGYEALKIKENNGTLKDKCNDLIREYKATGRQNELSSVLMEFKKNYKEKYPDILYELAYVEGKLFEDYIHDMDLVQKHASCNRKEIARQILEHANLYEAERFETVHNYIDVEHMILRKGSISCGKGEKVIIPMNMRDGSLICIGKGNPDWNYSGPHGAGRLLSRSKAKEKISFAEYKKTMEESHIYTTSVSKGTIDESPMVYKPMEEIIENIRDTVDVVNVIKPVYNFKAEEIEKPWQKEKHSSVEDLYEQDDFDLEM